MGAAGDLLKTQLMIGLVASFALLAAVPTTSADAATWHCGADVFVEGAHYDCKVAGAGADGDVIWCPQYMCAYQHIVSCWASPYGIYCW